LKNKHFKKKVLIISIVVFSFYILGVFSHFVHVGDIERVENHYYVVEPPKED